MAVPSERLYEMRGGAHRLDCDDELLSVELSERVIRACAAIRGGRENTTPGGADEPARPPTHPRPSY